MSSTTEKKEDAAADVEVVGVEVDVGSGRGSALRTAETLLRVTPMGLCVAALVVMLRNSQSNSYGSLSYDDLSGFKYLVYANGICAAYSLFSVFYIASSLPSNVARAWGLYLLDQVLTYVMLTAAAASSEILYLAYVGNQEVTWSEACEAFGGFCSRAKVSVGITFGTVLCYVGLSLVSSYRLFSTYEAPIPFLGKCAGVAAFPG